MWPKRKINLVVAPSSKGVAGVEACLNAFNLDYEVITADSQNSPALLFPPLGSERSLQRQTPPTEMVIWPEISEDNWQERAKDLGCNLKTINEFLHKIFKFDRIVLANRDNVILDQRPLIWHLLSDAGYEPSIIWSDQENWFFERGKGLHWVLPLDWMKQLEFDPTEMMHAKAAWSLQAESIAFYRTKAKHKYVGSILRQPTPLQEEIICATIAQVLDLGLSWYDIKMTLERAGIKIPADTIRWNFDDTELGKRSS